MEYVLDPLGLSARTIYCIGSDYAEHAKELGNAVPKRPVVFLKPTSSLCRTGERVLLPKISQQVDHEVELVVAIGKRGKAVPVEKALEWVAGYAVGIDVTARDLQDEAKSKALPWTLSKGFDTFAPLGEFVPRAQSGDGPFTLELKVNGNLRQSGNTAEMVFSVSKLIAFLSEHFTLQPGDLIYTGTPSGVGPLLPGDKVQALFSSRARPLEVSVE